jgi:NADH dehydrogenase [ubiquinone] 1 alpha subcomplex assembly factor 7
VPALPPARHPGLRERIRREGPVPFDAFVEAALYDSESGFFIRNPGAGRAGSDFITSPEVGTLFGLLAARALDGWWHEWGEPDPFVVVDAGAGRGRLAADVLRARPACAPALHCVLVERSAALRAAQRDLVDLEPADRVLGPAERTDPDEPMMPVPGTGPLATALAELPAAAFDGVVLANELLDNLSFRLVERAPDGWNEIRVGLDGDGDGLVEVPVPAPAATAAEADRVAGDAPVPVGARLPVPTGTAEWLRAVANVLRRGVLVVIDYADTAASLVDRGERGWLRTYRQHQRGAAPLADPGEQDITCDVPVEYLCASATASGFTLVEHTTQADWLRGLGGTAIADDAAAAWRARAAVGDLEAVAARSRVHEFDALTDPAGLGAHHVFVFRRGR